MRRTLLVAACAMLWIGSAAACATSSSVEPTVEDDTEPKDFPDATRPEDAGAPPTPEDGGELDASVDDSVCSTAGWCRVPLPDEHLTVVDIWPLEGRAFLLVKNPFFGAKLLEWDGKTDDFTSIDDETQNEVDEDGFVREPGTVWAPNDDEVYFTVTSAKSGYVYYGTRPTAPATKWTWTRARFDDCAHATLRVYGTSRDDVFATSCDAIYRKENDGQPGDAEPVGWTLDYANEDPTTHALFHFVSGTEPDDLWFSGGRRSASGGTTHCALLLHRTASGYETVFDSAFTGSSCGTLDGAIQLTGQLFYAQRTGPSRLVANLGSATGPGSFAIRITRSDPDGEYAWEWAKARVPNSRPWAAAWIPAEDDFLVSLVSSAGTGQLMRAKSIWSDGGAFEYESIALNGSLILTPMVQVRGTSHKNIWAVGGNYVLHKTSP